MKKIIEIIAPFIFVLSIFFSCTKKEALKGPTSPIVSPTGTVIPTTTPVNEWPTKIYMSSNYSQFKQVIQTSDGGFALIGNIESDSVDVWFLKTDSFGNEQWSKILGDYNSYDEGYSIIQTTDNNYIIGYNLDYRGFIMKADANGNCIWTRAYELGSWNYFEDICSIISVSNGYALYGSIHDDYSQQFLFLLTDFNGNCINVKSYGGSGWESPIQMIKTSNNNFLLCGYTNSFGSGYDDFYIIKIDYYGNFLWQNAYGSVADDSAYSIVETDDGIIIVGDTYTPDSSKILLMKVDPSGSEITRKIIGEELSMDYGKKIISAGDGNYIVGCGSYSLINGTLYSNLTIMKIDKNLNILWQKKYIPPENNIINPYYIDICKTLDNCFVIAGGIANSPEFLAKGFMMKIDSAGNKIW